MSTNEEDWRALAEFRALVPRRATMTMADKQKLFELWGSCSDSFLQGCLAEDADAAVILDLLLLAGASLDEIQKLCDYCPGAIVSLCDRARLTRERHPLVRACRGIYHDNGSLFRFLLQKLPGDTERTRRVPGAAARTRRYSSFRFRGRSSLNLMGLLLEKKSQASASCGPLLDDMAALLQIGTRISGPTQKEVLQCFLPIHNPVAAKLVESCLYDATPQLLEEFGSEICMHTVNDTLNLQKGLPCKKEPGFCSWKFGLKGDFNKESLALLPSLAASALSLEGLHLHFGSSTDPVLLQKFSRSIQLCHHLKSLQLDATRANDTPSTGLTQAVLAALDLNTITTLVVKGTRFDVDTISDAIKKNHTVRYLDMPALWESDKRDVLLDLLEHNTSLYTMAIPPSSHSNEQVIEQYMYHTMLNRLGRSQLRLNTSLAEFLELLNAILTVMVRGEGAPWQWNGLVTVKYAYAFLREQPGLWSTLF